jgi:endonuclease/exonuclease/phosphatase (EEP) superfamily protein YafD
LLITYGIIRVFGERWWPAALILFGPRWMLALPLAALLPPCLRIRPRYAWILAACAALLAGPLMDLCVPWRRALTAAGGGPHLRILTCNTHGTALKRPAMANLIAAAAPDVVAIQEWAGGYDMRPIGAGKWYVLIDQELRLESRYPVRRAGRVISGGWAYGSSIRYVLDTPAGPVPFYNLHLASPHNAIRAAVTLNASAESQVEGNQALRREQGEDLARGAREDGDAVILAGDFNLPADSEIYREHFAPFADAFATAGWGFGWTYRVRGTVTRIDHVLSGRSWVCRRCWVGPSVGSPHRPLIAELEWMAQPGQRPFNELEP